MGNEITKAKLSTARNSEEDESKRVTTVTNSDKGFYTTSPEAVIITCYFNPTHSDYRKKLFFEFYDTIKNCHHRIIECVFGDEEDFTLPTDNPNIEQIRTDILLWHKEALLNVIIKKLPKQFKYVFWLDCDLIFTNKNWIVESVERLSCTNKDNLCNIIQPFEFAYHLEKDEFQPNDATRAQQNYSAFPMNPRTQRRVWKSFASNYEKQLNWQSLGKQLT